MIDIWYFPVNDDFGLNDDLLDIESDGEEDEIQDGVRGVALLMEDLRSAVEATLDNDVISEEEKHGFGENLINTITPETLHFYRDLLKVQVGHFYFIQYSLLMFYDIWLSPHNFNVSFSWERMEK